MSSQSIDLLKFQDQKSLATAAAKAWIRAVTEAQQAGRLHYVALSGGRIVRELYHVVVEEARAQKTNFTEVHFFWGDERCVSPDDSESNFGTAKALLFEPLGVSTGQVHRILGEISPGEAVRGINSEVLRLLPHDASGRPVFDLIFLGLGEDAHVASLFPGASPDVVEAEGPFLPVTGPKPPPQRITMSYRTIAAARAVWVLASGAGKEKALRDSLAPNSATPLGRVIGSRLSTRIFTDIGNTR